MASQPELFSGVRPSSGGIIRNDAVEIGERDRPGRSSRRLADWTRALPTSPNSAQSGGGMFSAGRRKPRAGRPALPQSNCIVLRGLKSPRLPSRLAPRDTARAAHINRDAPCWSCLRSLHFGPFYGTRVKQACELPHLLGELLSGHLPALFIRGAKDRGRMNGGHDERGQRRGYPFASLATHTERLSQKALRRRRTQTNDHGRPD
jgi:hypothetical protein